VIPLGFEMKRVKMRSRDLFLVAVAISLTQYGCSSSKSTPTSMYLPTQVDCSPIESLSPDSPEAQQIVQEFIANYKQDFPTEYMAIEQLWAVDKLGEYAIVQGRVTQEENNIIVVHQMERGFVMVADYIVNVPGAKHAVIPEYFIEKLPDAPPELFHCLDLSRYVGESKP
jgi:hypothetical protein